MSANLIAIATVDSNLGVENDGREVVQFPNAKKFIRTTTRGKYVLMNHPKFLTMGFPLIERKNIVLRDGDYHRDSEYLTFMPKKRLDDFLGSIDDDVFVLGDAKMFEEYLDKLRKVYLIEYNDKLTATASFPDIKRSHEWSNINTVSRGYFRDHGYVINEYRRKF